MGTREHWRDPRWPPRGARHGSSTRSSFLPAWPVACPSVAACGVQPGTCTGAGREQACMLHGGCSTAAPTCTLQPQRWARLPLVLRSGRTRPLWLAASAAAGAMMSFMVLDEKNTCREAKAPGRTRGAGGWGCHWRQVARAQRHPSACSAGWALHAVLLRERARPPKRVLWLRWSPGTGAAVQMAKFPRFSKGRFERAPPACLVLRVVAPAGGGSIHQHGVCHPVLHSTQGAEEWTAWPGRRAGRSAGASAGRRQASWAPLQPRAGRGPHGPCHAGAQQLSSSAACLCCAQGRSLLRTLAPRSTSPLARLLRRASITVLHSRRSRKWSGEPCTCEQRCALHASWWQPA